MIGTKTGTKTKHSTMYTIISPAKTFDRKHKRGSSNHASLTPIAIPELESYAHPIVETALTMPIGQLAQELHLSDKLAHEARRDWLAFVGQEVEPRRAMELYSGMVFKKIGAQGLTPSQWQEADKRLGICSFVYGLLRPSEGIRPYRMEGSLRLESGQKVFDYWSDVLTPILIERAQRQGGKLIFLASEEMKQLFHWDEVMRAIEVITPTFMTRSPEGKLKQIVIYTKMARGEMAGAIIRSQIDNDQELQGLSPAGFIYHPELSSDREWIYVLG